MGVGFGVWGLEGVLKGLPRKLDFFCEVLAMRVLLFGVQASRRVSKPSALSARGPPPPLRQKHQATSSVASSLVKYWEAHFEESFKGLP